MLPPRARLVLACLVLAGCAAPAAEPGQGDAEGAPAFDVFPLDLEHDHADPSLHAVAVGFEPLARLSTASGGRPAQMAVNLALGERLLVASLASPTHADPAPGMSLLVADVSDPAAPRLLSVTPFAGGGVESVAITPDDRYAFVGTEFTGAVGIWAVDLADPARPRPVGFTPQATEGPHNVRYAKVGERHLVLASVSHVQTLLSIPLGEQDPLPVGPHLRLDVFEFDPARPEMPMRLLSSYAPEDREGIPEGAAIVHDAVLQVHPLTGQALAYVANWDRGLRIVDLTDPATPREVGKLTDPAPNGMLTIHTVKPMPQLIGGRHYTVATSQCGYHADKSCLARIVDTTDPAAPALVATWGLPEDVHGASYISEIFDVQGTRVVFPWRHGGTWAVDLEAPEAPRTLGYYFGQGAPQDIRGFGSAPAHNAVVLRDDVAFLADLWSGIEVVRLAS